ncbi:MAG: molybdopterin dinucleotide binding domain-containing protein [Chloroflexota bacterium]
MAARKSFSRREFLKASGAGASALLAAWAGMRLARWKQAEDAWIPTTCPACSAGCGLLVRVRHGQVLDVAANPAHPRPFGAGCPSQRVDLGLLVDGPRWGGALSQPRRGSGDYVRITWEAATGVLAATLRDVRPQQIAFLAGAFPDHLFDLLQLLNQVRPGMHLARLDPLALQEGRVTLLEATRACFGAARLPHFDLAQAELGVLFGADLGEPWLAAGGSRRLLLSPRREAGVQEWVATPPGSLARLARALGGVLEAKLGHTSLAGEAASAEAGAAGLPLEELERLAQRMLAAGRTLAVPGSLALGQVDGLAAASAILWLNTILGNLGKPGGVYLPVEAPVFPSLNRPSSSLAELGALAERMRAGQVKVLLVHGADPLGDLPPALGFAQALEQVERVISFSPRPDATAALADTILPDRLPLESWGYHKPDGADRPLVSAIQPALPAGGQGRATVDVLLAAARLAGCGLPYDRELDFIHAALAPLARLEGASPQAFWDSWSQRGGWWTESPVRMPAVAIANGPGQPGMPASDGVGQTELGLTLVPGSIPGQAGPIWVEVHPSTARRQGLRHHQQVRVRSVYGAVEARLQLAAELHPESLAMPLEAGLALVGAAQNSSGDLAASAGRVWLEG